jgi:flagellar L-ring protein precursor FlgH
MHRLSAILLLVVAVIAPAWCESLWQAETLADGNLYADATARRRGDLLTIVISETTSVSENQNTKTKRENTAEIGMGQLPGINKGSSAAGSAQSGLLPGLAIDSNTDFKGEASYALAHDVKSSIAVQVVDILDNGSLVIRGSREVLVNEDRKTISLSGIVRPSDIHSDNTVSSDKLYDLRVSIIGEGPLSRAQGQGWLGKLLNILWPF